MTAPAVASSATTGSAFDGNLGPKEAAKRKIFGLVMAIAALAVGAWILIARQPWWYALLASPLAAMAATGILQARAKT